MKKLGLFVMALLSTVASFAVDPHGARVYTSHNEPTTFGTVILIILIVLLASFLIWGKIVMRKDSITTQQPTIKKDPLMEEVERNRQIWDRLEKEAEEGRKARRGCLYILIGVGILVLYDFDWNLIEFLKAIKEDVLPILVLIGIPMLIAYIRIFWRK